MKNPVIIFGANELGRAAKEILESNEVIIYGFLDDDASRHGTELDEVVVLGSTDDDGFLKLIGKKTEAFVAFDNNKVRKATVQMLKDKRKVMPVNAIHKHAYIAPTAHIGYGNFINAGATVANNAKVSNHCLVHAGATIDYSAQLGDLVQVGAGANIGAEAVVEDEVFIGAGAVIVGGVKIEKGTRIGAGSVVIANVEAGETVFGNPAKAIS